MKGVNQICVLTLPMVCGRFLRQDPNVVMAGRYDKETAELAVQAALTGHLVLTTLHKPAAMYCRAY